MNQRAIDLYKEACEFAYDICKKEGRTGGPSDHIWNTMSTGRFAELIVLECARWLGNREFASPEALKQHFGVE